MAASRRRIHLPLAAGTIARSLDRTWSEGWEIDVPADRRCDQRRGLARRTWFSDGAHLPQPAETSPMRNAKTEAMVSTFPIEAARQQGGAGNGVADADADVVNGGPESRFRNVVVLPLHASRRAEMRRFAKTARIARRLPPRAFRANRSALMRSSQAGPRGFKPIARHPEHGQG